MEFAINKELINELFDGQKPYKKRLLKKIDSGYPHTYLTEEILKEIFKLQKPSFVVEIGSMIGGSAIMMANSARKLGEFPSIVCIDPFSGDVNMWAWEKGLIENQKWRFIKVKDGRSTIRDRFEGNVIKEKLTHQIIPLEMTSLVGLRLIQRLNREGRLSQLPDCIYLDSAHELGETYLEAKTAFETLSGGGILFGDDWSWPAVKHDISKFAEENSLTITFIGNHWYTKKQVDVVNIITS